MPAHLDIYGTAIFGVVGTLIIWRWLNRAMQVRGKSRWRPVLLCLPLLLAALIYGLFWLGFFTSPATAVQLHAVRLTLEHALGRYLPLIGGVWLVSSLTLLLPLIRRRS